MEYNIWVPMVKSGYGSTLSLFTFCRPHLINHDEIHNFLLKCNDIYDYLWDLFSNFFCDAGLEKISA